MVSFLMFCMGSMTILGSIEEGLVVSQICFTLKALWMVFHQLRWRHRWCWSNLSAVPLLIYQGGLTLLASLLGDNFTSVMINEPTAVGGILLIGLGLSILDIKKINVLDLLPSLVFIVPLVIYFA